MPTHYPIQRLTHKVTALAHGQTPLSVEPCHLQRAGILPQTERDSLDSRRASTYSQPASDEEIASVEVILQPNELF